MRRADVSRRMFTAGAPIAFATLATHARGQVLGSPIDNALEQALLDEAAAGFRGVVATHSAAGDSSWCSTGFVPETRFWIASISKAVTATLAVRLFQSGGLDLSLSVRDAFAFVEGDIGARTLRQLLGHRAGLGHNYAADGVTDREAAVRAIVARGIEHDGFQYSNDGYCLAVAIMEQVTGRSFEQLVRQEIFAPVGMHGAVVWGEDLGDVPMASYPTRGGGRMMRNGAPVRNYGQLGASGVCASAGDMIAFLRALHREDFLSADSRAALWTPGWATGAGGPPRSGISYGLGWRLVVESGVVTSAGHGGNEDWLRHNGQMETDPRRSQAIVVLSNAGDIGDVSWSQRVLARVHSVLN